MYILEQDHGMDEPNTVLAVSKSAFALAEYAASLCGTGWSLHPASSAGYVIRGPENKAWYWITPILEISSVGK